jgi:hypothetical protein
MFKRLTTLFFVIASRLFIICGLILALAPKVEAQEAGDTFEAHVGHGKVNIVDFRRSPNSGGLPLVFRIEYKSFESVPSDGFFGRITRGKMTFSLPRQNNPEMAYDKTASIAARLTQGPAFGDTVDYQAREIASNVFEVHWKEPRGGRHGHPCRGFQSARALHEYYQHQPRANPGGVRFFRSGQPAG